MNNKITLKPCINKKNGQINFSLPRKKIPTKLKKDIDKIEKIKFNIIDWE